MSRIAWAQAYPTRPVRIIVPYPPGGGTDIIARLMGQWLSERLGQQFIIENRPGGNSNIATEAAVRAPPDGYMLLVVDIAPTINATYYNKLNFDFIRDTAPVAGIASQPAIMEVNPSVLAKTVPEFIAYAKANPGKLNMASNRPFCDGEACRDGRIIPVSLTVSPIRDDDGSIIGVSKIARDLSEIHHVHRDVNTQTAL